MDTEEFSPNHFGSLCYVNDHVGFFGTIKSSPADFVVTEIDVSGNLVTDACNTANEKCEIEFEKNDTKATRKQKNDAEIKRVKYGVSALVNDKCMAGAKNANPFNDNTADFELDHIDFLHYFLDLSVQESLDQFSCSVKTAWRSHKVEDQLNELSLGLFTDKNERALIHSAVRQTYPFLLTFTKATELLVKPNQDYQELCNLTSEEEADGFFIFLDAKLENSTFTFKPDDCKEHRTAVHHFISKKFGKLLETKSFSEKGISGLQKLCISVRLREKKGSSRKRKSMDVINKEDLYTGFTLQKENLETLEAISYLASSLGVLPSDFSYAGIKDKKAITYQAMVVRKVAPERLKQVESIIGKKSMKLHNIHTENKPLRLGWLSGNNFSIIVRNIKNHSNDASVKIQERIGEAVQNIKEKGFLNYYGPQRFGKVQNSQSNDIGLALLKEEMEKAVKLLLTPDNTEDPVNNAKKHFIQTEDAKGALALMPDYKIRERMLLRAINRYGANQEGYTRAWFSIPHSMRIFYVHAFCSKVWNEAASYRFKSYGLKVVEGDLVLCNQDDNSLLSDKVSVHIVTKEEEMSNKYSINQVVLPMPGYSIKYPANKIGEWYNETLAEAGLQACSFRVSSLQLNIPGCYRHILKHPYKLSYELNLGDQIETEKLTNDGMSLKPYLVLKFKLDSSCYATVCLREIMKCNF
ncbi:hypothetical protein GDO86_005792 [Hymenochirus boettgeri]|uniref:Pseudouridylate synthase PUS7L n=1 Tax=Hymenochirus boettgeri TaxID=247094 RepID=A0A8T2JAX7_9PIPI|nr:hypothetical protein GDO86_005792 [Hymenochirus boettgeri]